jgi:hypothetical protein
VKQLARHTGPLAGSAPGVTEILQSLPLSEEHIRAGRIERIADCLLIQDGFVQFPIQIDYSRFVVLRGTRLKGDFPLEDIDLLPRERQHF